MESIQAAQSAIIANDLLGLRAALDEWRRDSHPIPPLGPPRQSMLPFQYLLWHAAKNDQPDVVDVLLSQGCQVETDTVVAATGKTGVFDVLFKHGYDVNLCLGHVGDALILATCKDRTSFISYLLQHGADPNANTRNDLSALECAAQSCSIATISLLLAHGAELSRRRVLCRAAFYGREDVVSFLLDNGAAIDEIPDDKGIGDIDWGVGVGTALHAAVAGFQVETTRLLLEKGAKLDVKDSYGRTAVEHASHNPSCMEVLVNYADRSSDTGRRPPEK